MVPTRGIAGRGATDAVCGLSPVIEAHEFACEVACKPVRMVIVLTA